MLLLLFLIALANAAIAKLTQVQEQRLFDRLYQTNLRGPRWTGNDNQNTLTDLMASSMRLAGLDVETLNYTLNRWDPRWWSLSLALNNGTTIGLPTTGYWPYSGNSGLGGVTAPLRDARTYEVRGDGTGDNSTLDLEDIPPSGAVIFFDNPSPTRNYSEPGYRLLGTSRDIPGSDIPELGNLTNPHWQSAKTLNLTALRTQRNVVAMISAWTSTSDANAALQYLPNDAPPGKNGLYDVPGVYVGAETGRVVRGLIGRAEVRTATVVLDAPTVAGAQSKTVVGRLKGTGGGEGSVLVYTHSDGPSIIEENGPLLLLAMAEYFAVNRPAINLDFVITTGHMSGGRLSETRWMDERPAILRKARAAIVCEHFGAVEWKDVEEGNGERVYTPTGGMEPMWTMGNDSTASALLHRLYLEAFEGTPENVRMALLAPQSVNGVRSKWYGAGGSSVLGRSNIPTIGIIPQPDYLWAAHVDGGWSKLDLDMVVVQVNVVLRLIESLDRRYMKGEL